MPGTEVGMHDVDCASTMVWALPFLTVLAPSKKANEARDRIHKTSMDWTVIMMKLVSRWLKKRRWFLIGDGAYACHALAVECIKKAVPLISRLRMDAQLFEFPQPPVPGKRGRKKIRGKRIQLKELAEDSGQDWKTIEARWYGGTHKTLRMLSHTCLWYQGGKTPVTLRYVLVTDPEGEKSPVVFFSTDAEVLPETIIEYYVLRWNIEVTFEETRVHLGIETQRQWSDRAIARTTPLLMGLFSLVTLMAFKLKKIHEFTPLSSAWYCKGNEATFSDVIAFVRRSIWAHKYCLNWTLAIFVKNIYKPTG